MVASQIHLKPTNDDGHSRIDTTGGHEEGAILNVSVVVHVQQDREASERDANGYQGEQEPVPCEIGEESDQHRKPE